MSDPLDLLSHPDMVGTAAYRAVWEALSDAISSADDDGDDDLLGVALAELDAIDDESASIRRIITGLDQ